MLPVGYKGGFMIVPYREIAPPPSDETAALSLIRSVIERHVGRLEELLAEHEQIEAEEAAERYDRAALDCSPAFERHRRYQSARHRELMRTLETLRKMRKEEFGTGNGEEEKADGKWRMANVKWRMANVRWRMTDAGRGMTAWRVASAEWRVKREWPVASGQWPLNPERVASRCKRRAGHCKMCKTKPIWNQRKVHCCLRLNRLRPSRRVKNEANSHRQ